MDAALEFLAGPAARARVVGVERQAGTWCATDGGVSLFVEREQRDGVLFGVLPDIASGPLGERAELGEDLAGGQGEELIGCRLARDLDCWRPQAGDPGGVGAESAEERLDFAQAAATIGRGLIEDAELRLPVRVRIVRPGR